MLDAVCDVIAAGGDVTFGELAAVAGVPERTVNRYSPNRQALIGAVFEHVNRRIGFDGNLPRTRTEMTTMVQQAFSGLRPRRPDHRRAAVLDRGTTSTRR